MTDQRDRARVMIAELTGLDTGYDCCLTGESAINVIRTALADAERGVWEEAAMLIIKQHKSTDSDKWLDLASAMKEKTSNDFIDKTQAAEEAPPHGE